MKEKTLSFKYVADYTIGGKSTIELKGGLDQAGEVAKAFVSEFKYLESVSSEIVIDINSSGGSVISGLDIVIAILDCKIPTTSRIVGVAASMASVIALATDTTTIMDYALLMWHNPFSPSNDAQDDQLDAFAGMLTKIYSGRLGMTEEEVIAFMDGDEGKDGTWFNADKAEKFRLVSKIIPTQIQRSLQENLSDLDTENISADEIVNELQLIAANIEIGLSNDTSIEDKKTIKRIQQVEPLHDTEVLNAATDYKKVSNKINMDHMDLTKISASLNIEDATVEAIEARVKDIVANNSKLESSVAAKNEELVAATKTLSEKDVEIAKVSAELETATTAYSEIEAKVEGYEAKIRGFEAAAKEAHTAKIESIVNEAADAGKITAEAKDTWNGLLVASFDSAFAALEGLSGASAGKVKLSEKVSASVEEKKEITKEVEKEIEAKVVLPSINGLMKEISKNPKNYKS